MANRLLPFTCLLLLALSLMAWIQIMGMQLFSGMDGGVLINAAWQEMHGAVPYHDFFTAAPPLLLVPAGWAFHYWGVTWFSFVKLISYFSAITFLWNFGIIWDGTKSQNKAMIFATLLQIIIVVPVSWWWYNEITWMGCVLFFSSALSLLCNARITAFSGVSFVLSGAALGLLKVNLVTVLLFPVLLLLLFNRRLRVFTVLGALVMFLLDMIFLSLNHINPLEMIANYKEVSGRLSGDMLYYLLRHPNEYDYGLQLYSLPVMAIGIFIWIKQSAWADPVLKRNFYALLAIAVLVALVGITTNYQRKAQNAGCLIALLPFLQVQLGAATLKWTKIAERTCMVIVLGLSLVACYVGLDRTQFYYFGMVSYASPHFRMVVVSPPMPELFANMRISIPFFMTLQDTERALVDFHVIDNPKRSVFFGPNMDFSYAAFNLPAPTDLPLWWEKVPSTLRGDIYPFDEHLPYFCNAPLQWIPPGQPLNPHVQRFLDDKFDVCIFLNSKHHLPIMSYIPGDIRADIYENYELYNYAHITVFLRRPEIK